MAEMSTAFWETLSVYGVLSSFCVMLFLAFRFYVKFLIYVLLFFDFLFETLLIGCHFLNFATHFVLNLA
jgi:hypothetical protein